MTPSEAEHHGVEGGSHPQDSGFVDSEVPGRSRGPAHTTLVGQEQFGARDDVVRLAPLPVGRVLDVGCGPGLTGAALREAGAREVWGVERDPELARAAATRLDRVIETDLAADPLLGLAPASVDLLVYADVLEHLVDPWSLLAAQRMLLRPGGAVIISLPNVRHIRVVGDLLINGAFTYRAEGIMSIGHLRFFTTRSMRAMLTGAGYRIVREEANYAPWGRRLSRLSLGLLDDLFAQQRLFLGRVPDDPRDR